MVRSPLVFDTGVYASLTTEDLFLEKMRELAVVTVHKAVHLRNLYQLTQESDETIRAYVARVTATADMCGMIMKCSCGLDNSYRDLVVHQLVIHGMRDQEIRQRVLSRNTSGDLTTLAKLVDYIAAEEAGALESSDLHTGHAVVGAVKRKSEFQKNKSKCAWCGGPKHTQANNDNDRQKMCKAWGKTCDKCKKTNHISSQCRSSPKSDPVVASVSQTPAVQDDSEVAGITGYIFGLHDASRAEQQQQVWDTQATFQPSNMADLVPVMAALREHGPVTTLPLPHHVHDTINGWLPTRPRSSPTITVQFSLDRSAYAHLQVPMPRMIQGHRPGRSDNRNSVPDSGAELTILPRSTVQAMSIKEDTTFPVMTQINGANSSPITVDGAILVTVSATNPKTGATRTSRQLAYISSLVQKPYLSLNCCIDLGILPASFPEIGVFSPPDQSAPVATLAGSQCSNSGVPTQTDSPCSCPRREMPPSTPPMLPCAPTPENVEQLKQYILKRYAASSFNCCEHQPLKLMDDSPPLRLFTDESARPVAVHTPSQVPIHWRDQVKAGLDRDEQLGVLERVPVNEPVEWCSRMVITPKHDGTPRRVVDFSPLNKHTPRQTHHTQSPWSIVSSIPAGKVKSTIDCWNGYHSVPIHPADRKLTTFITTWGRYRYRTSPQGLLSAGDGYSHRKADIMAGFTGNQQTCVDDSIVYNDTIEQNFFDICQFLEIGGKGGCTFNPAKFQFAQQEVEFLCFKIPPGGIKTNDEFLQNILNFPAPKNITDVRAWQGAINQISFGFASAPIMAPFRHLLSAKIPFQWTTELQEAFDASKQEIMAQCSKGVRSFDPQLPTALATDWSKLGLGFWLTQKHCSCSSLLPGCCSNGWQTVYVGSRFCSSAESRYHPIEGEALAIFYGLDKCKFFILGLPKLILCVDHNPLLAIFGADKSLEAIHNPRLLNYKLKSMRYRFTVYHIPGKKNVIPDTMSRRSDSPIMTTPSRMQVDWTAQSNVSSKYSEHLGQPSWVSPPTIAAITNSTEDLHMGYTVACMAEVNSWSFINGIAAEDRPQAISWPRLESACITCPQYTMLHKTLQLGIPDDKAAWDEQIKEFYPHRHSLSTVGPVILLHDRPVIPAPLRRSVMDHLHAGHQGATAMFERASSSLYWPNFRIDLINHTAACTTCSKYQPSNPAMPPVTPDEPSYPFQSICADFFTISSHTYLAVVDRYSNWLSVFKLDRDTSEQVINVLRAYVSIFGIPVVLTSDGASVFTSREMEAFCHKFGIIHRVSTAYHPRANKRAEVAVKSAKRLIRGNTSQTGTLHTDDLARAILQHRNTPCPLTGLSPAQIVFGRVLRDFLPLQPGKFVPREEWRLAASQREVAYSKRRMLKQEQLTKGSKPLTTLKPGCHVRIQDQSKTGPHAGLWTQTGVVLEVHPHDAYLVSVNGSRTVTKRNRQFLRQYTPAEDDYVRPRPAVRPMVPALPHILPTPTPVQPQHTPVQPQQSVQPQQHVEPAQFQPPQPAPTLTHQDPPTPATPQLTRPAPVIPHLPDHDYCAPAMIPAQAVGHAAAVSHPQYVYVPTMPSNNTPYQIPVTFPGQTYTYQTTQPTMYHTYNTNPTVYAMPYPMMNNNTNANAGYSPNRMFQ